jgi:site-specific recombinase XerD
MRMTVLEPFGRSRYMRVVKSAWAAAGLKKAFGPGQLRHSVTTWAVDAGADLATVSTFLDRHGV